MVSQLYATRTEVATDRFLKVPVGKDPDSSVETRSLLTPGSDKRATAETCETPGLSAKGAECNCLGQRLRWNQLQLLSAESAMWEARNHC